MPLNTEEAYDQETFNRKQFSRPTKEQLEIALLEERLKHAQNTIAYYEEYIEKQSSQRITYSESEIDKLFEQRSEIKEAIRRVVTDTQFNDTMFKYKIMDIVGWKL